jgi:hypothetical protein
MRASQRTAREYLVRMPVFATRSFILGSARAALISLLSLSMISAGVFLGAPKPNYAVASYPVPFAVLPSASAMLMMIGGTLIQATHLMLRPKTLMNTRASKSLVPPSSRFRNS